MNRIDRFFKSGRKAFIPYITVGHPSMAATDTILDILVEEGADIIEFGFPFSDPMADGPVIQASSQQALSNGFTRQGYFETLASFRERHPEVPVVIFTYYNPLFSFGVEAYVAKAAEAGADGMLIVDLPLEEQPQVRPMLDRHELHLIQLIAPTTPETRARQILEHATGFVYQIARRGVTGMQTSLANDASGQSALIKELTDLPVALGFGVSSGEQAKAIAGTTDGVVVGSALVKTVTDHQEAFEEPLRKLARELATAVHSQ